MCFFVFMYVCSYALFDVCMYKYTVNNMGGCGAPFSRGWFWLLSIESENDFSNTEKGRGGGIKVSIIHLTLSLRYEFIYCITT